MNLPIRLFLDSIFTVELMPAQLVEAPIDSSIPLAYLLGGQVDRVFERGTALIDRTDAVILHKSIRFTTTPANPILIVPKSKLTFLQLGLKKSAATKVYLRPVDLVNLENLTITSLDFQTQQPGEFYLSLNSRGPFSLSLDIPDGQTSFWIYAALKKPEDLRSVSLVLTYNLF